MRTYITTALAGLALAACATPADTSTSQTTAKTTAKAVLSKGDHAHVDDVFMHYDFNGDGIITAYEQNEYLKSDFAKADANGDGYTDGGERLSRSAYFSKRKLNGDANGDGKISRGEFEAYVASKS